MMKNKLLLGQNKRKEQIIDICFEILKFWLANPDKTLSWVLKELGKIN
jgi:hypothetical protein